MAFLFLLLTGCQKDDQIKLFQQEAIQKNELQIREVKINDIPKEEFGLGVLGYFGDKGIKGKYKAKKNFRIIGEKARLMQEGDFKSYTFQIDRNSTKNSLENLVLNLNKDGTYQAYIVVYKLTRADKLYFMRNGKLPLLKNKVSLTPVEFSEKGIKARPNRGSDEDCYQYIEKVIISRGTGWEDIGYELVKVPCPDSSQGSPSQGYPSQGGSYPETPGTSGGGYNNPSSGGFPSGGGSGTGAGAPNPNPTSSGGDLGAYNQTVDGTVIITAPIIRFNKIIKLKELLELGQDSLEKEWLYNATAEQVASLYDFVVSEQKSELAIAFAIKAIQAWMNDGEVDLIYKVILDATFVENDCLYGVYEDMGKASTFDNYLKNFEGDMSVADLTFSASMTLPDSISAQTSAPLTSNMIEIEFNLNNLDRPSLDVARTLVHEMIHATMYRWLLKAAETGALSPEGGMTQEQLINYINNLRTHFPGLYDYYYERRLPNWGHEQMAAHFIDIIKTALSEYDNNAHSDNIYEALAWVGLKSTISWNHLTQQEKDNIIQIRANFLNNNPNCQ